MSLSYETDHVDFASQSFVAISRYKRALSIIDLLNDDDSISRSSDHSSDPLPFLIPYHYGISVSSVIPYSRKFLRFISEHILTSFGLNVNNISLIKIKLPKFNGGSQALAFYELFSDYFKVLVKLVFPSSDLRFSQSDVDQFRIEFYDDSFEYQKKCDFDSIGRVILPNFCSVPSCPNEGCSLCGIWLISSADTCLLANCRKVHYAMHHIFELSHDSLQDLRLFHDSSIGDLSRSVLDTLVEELCSVATTTSVRETCSNVMELSSVGSPLH